MNILVTGGPSLADAFLAGGHDVRVLDDLSTGFADNVPPAAALIVVGCPQVGRRLRHPTHGDRKARSTMPNHLDLVIRPLTRDEAVAVSAWRYGGALAMYDGQPGQEDDLLAMTAEGYGYYALLQNDDFVGYSCFGPEGRVPGQPAAVDDLLDLGGGLRPDLVGKGLGAVGLPLILAFARERFSPQGFRTAIASFNRRSIVLCRWAGFRPTCTFPGPGGREFTELVLANPEARRI